MTQSSAHRAKSAIYQLSAKILQVNRINSYDINSRGEYANS